MLSIFSAAPSRMRQKEVDALWWLYEHTAGKNWKDNSGWAGPSTDPCRRFSTERRWAPNAILDPILNYKCQERIPRNGKYNWRIVRDEYPVMMAKYCPEPYDVQFAFEPLQGDV